MASKRELKRQIKQLKASGEYWHDYSTYLSEAVMKRDIRIAALESENEKYKEENERLDALLDGTYFGGWKRDDVSGHVNARCVGSPPEIESNKLGMSLDEFTEHVEEHAEKRKESLKEDEFFKALRDITKHTKDWDAEDWLHG